MRFTLISSSLVLLSLFAACSSPAPAPPAKSPGKAVDAATAGSVTGRVVFEGTPPAPEPLKMGSDPACTEGSGSKPQNDAVLIAKDGAIQNVFVYVKDGLDPAYSFEVPATTVQFYQRGCRYAPRIFGVRAGQPIEIINDDSTMHNVHAMPTSNQEFNKMEQVKGARLTHTFTVPEVMVRFKCDVHGWMTAYVGVMAHPFFAVTGANGSFDIKGLPPGTYTIEAWHERFGTRTQKITVAEHQTQTVPFAFTAAK